MRLVLRDFNQRLVAGPLFGVGLVDGRPFAVVPIEHEPVNGIRIVRMPAPRSDYAYTSDSTISSTTAVEAGRTDTRSGTLVSNSNLSVLCGRSPHSCSMHEPAIFGIPRRRSGEFWHRDRMAGAAREWGLEIKYRIRRRADEIQCCPLRSKNNGALVPMCRRTPSPLIPMLRTVASTRCGVPKSAQPQLEREGPASGLFVTFENIMRKIDRGNRSVKRVERLSVHTSHRRPSFGSATRIIR